MHKTDTQAPTAAPMTSSTVAEVARRHSISRGLLYRLIKEGRGPRLVKVGKRSIITAADEAQWLYGLRQQAEAAQ
jgi:predicted DNA-binding transcriptional regulator AlpA